MDLKLSFSATIFSMRLRSDTVKRHWPMRMSSSAGVRLHSSSVTLAAIWRQLRLTQERCFGLIWGRRRKRIWIMMLKKLVTPTEKQLGEVSTFSQTCCERDIPLSWPRICPAGSQLGQRSVCYNRRSWSGSTGPPPWHLCTWLKSCRHSGKQTRFGCFLFLVVTPTPGKKFFPSCL